MMTVPNDKKPNYSSNFFLAYHLAQKDYMQQRLQQLTAEQRKLVADIIHLPQSTADDWVRKALSELERDE
ncbi:MAG: hypothetical protein ABF969_15105 [Sporolactobacillus sp.]